MTPAPSRILLLPAMLSLLLPLAPLPASAGPREEVEASIVRFAAARSYRASMTTAAPRPMRSELDFVAPDRYRIRMPGVGTQTVIGSTMYMTLQGRTMKLPIPKGTLSQWSDPARLAQNTRDMRVAALGSEPVEGTSARKYRVEYLKPMAGAMTLWIGADGYPLQILTAGAETDVGRGGGATTIRYSNFNDAAIRVEPR